MFVERTTSSNPYTYIQILKCGFTLAEPQSSSQSISVRGDDGDNTFLENSLGVLMFIHSSLVYNVLCLDVLACELLVVSVISPHFLHQFCLAVYYRPPSSSLDSLTDFSPAVLSISPSCSNNLILLGDFNTNLDSALCRHLMFSLAPFKLTTSGTHTSVSNPDWSFVHFTKKTRL